MTPAGTATGQTHPGRGQPARGTTRALAIDLFCGLGGWAEGLLAEGYDVIGFDIERHVYGEHRYPGQLVIQDVLTLHGSQFRDATLIVASPPCQEYSYMAMPWRRAKQIAKALRGDGEFPEGYTGSRTVAELTALFDACFRIQREACEAAGRHIPLIVENVRGAQPWVGRARFNFGSFYLWGDVPALMPIAKHVKVPTMGAGWYPPGHPKHTPGLAFNGHAERGLKAAGFRFDGGGGSFQTASVIETGIKQGGDCFAEAREGGEGGTSASFGSKSPARKAAAALIAKIPLPLSRHIASVFRPQMHMGEAA